MTTPDVIAALRANGWRYERLAGNQGGKNMVLTNAPPGYFQCRECREWRRRSRHYNSKRYMCHDCAREYQRLAQRRRRQKI